MVRPYATVRSEGAPKNEEKRKLLPRTHVCHFEFGTLSTPDYIYIPGPTFREHVPALFGPKEVSLNVGREEAGDSH
jgi:hypothetical protein